VNEHEWPTRGCGLQWHHHKQKIAGRVGMSYEWTMQPYQPSRCEQNWTDTTAWCIQCGSQWNSFAYK
jgi:hypothetical protein